MKEIKTPSSAEEKKWQKQRCAELIVENMEAEPDAIKKYLPLLNMLEEGGYKKAADLIREIISDEKNHLLILQGLLLEFDGDIPVADDNVQGALRNIKKAIEKDADED